MGWWPPQTGPRVKGFETATPKLICVPFVGDLQTLTYRNDVYTDGAPKTWDELIAKGKEGVAAGKIKYPIVFRGVTGSPIVASWYPVFLSWGGEFFDDKWHVTFNSPAGKASADFFVGTMKQNAPPGVVEPATIVVGNVLGVHAHRAVALDEVKPGRVIHCLAGARRVHRVGDRLVMA